MFFDITKADFIGQNVLNIEFQDGSSGRVDLTKYSRQGGVFSKLKDADYAKAFRVEQGTLVWGEDELDIAPETLYEDATGKNIEFQRRTSVVC
jgi:hypothetical protein